MEIKDKCAVVTGPGATIGGRSESGPGMGGELLRRLLAVARQRGLPRLIAHIPNGNVAMRLCAGAGMRLHAPPCGAEVTPELEWATADGDEGRGGTGRPASVPPPG
jgi:hypothetical protein